MNLQSLKKNIEQKLQKNLSVNALPRNFCIYYGGIFQNLRSHFIENEIPSKTEAWVKTWRWLDVTLYLKENNRIFDEIKKTLIELSTIQTASDISDRENINLITHTIQLFLIFDLTNSEALKLLEDCNTKINKIIDELNLNSVIKQIGVFVLSRFSQDDLQKVDKNKFSSLYDNIKDTFDFIFLAQNQNENNFFIKNNEEWISVISILLSFLGLRPYRMTLDEYKEWILRHSPSSYGVSGFAAMKYTLPIKLIAEYVLLVRGNELLNEAFFHVDEQNLIKVSQSMFSKINAESSFINAEEFAGKVIRLSEKDMVDPLSSITNPVDTLPPNDVVAQYELIINKINTYLNYNKKILTIFAQKLYHNFEYSVTNTLDILLNSYKGGASIAKDLMLKIFNHFNNQNQKQGSITSTSVSSNELLNSLENLKNEAKSEPPFIAMILRGIPFFYISLSLIYCLNQFELEIIKKFIWIGLFLIFGIMVSLFIQRHAWKNRFTTALINLQKNLFDFWHNSLIQRGKACYYDLLPSYLNHAKSLQQDMENLEKRLKFIFNYISSGYRYQIKPENSFYIHIVRTKEQMQYFLEFIQDDFIQKEPEKIIRQKLLSLWWRLANENDTNLNPLEWQILEKAAIHLLPYSDKLFQISICNYLSQNEEQKNIILNKLKNSYKPFIILNPNTPTNTNNYVIIQWNKDSCHNINVIDGALNYLKHSNEKVVLEKALENYSFSLISIKEGMQINNLKI